MKDPLDRETSVSVKVTEHGLEAKANSRALSGLDRLLGNVSELLNIGMEGKISIERAKIEGRTKLIEAAAKQGVKIIAEDRAFAERALQQHFDKVVREQENKDGVAREALEDLRRSPPTPTESQTGADKLNEPFLDRLDHYAAFASTEELRQRWGRVFATEVRKPGTFNPRVLRAVDELDPDTAVIFEKLCKQRIYDSIPKAMARDLRYPDQVRLVESGLLVEPGLGQKRNAQSVTFAPGDDWHMIAFGGGRAVGVPQSTDIGRTSLGSSDPIAKSTADSAPNVPIFLLTSTGLAVASILEGNEDEAVMALARAIAEKLPTSRVRVFRLEGSTLTTTTEFSPILP